MKASVLLSTIVLVLCLTEMSEAQIFRRRTVNSGGGRVTRSVTSCSQYAQHPLIQLIRQEQMLHVGESSGFEDYECFTWEELARFKENDVPRQVTDRLKEDQEFLAIVAQVREAASGERDRLLYCASATYKPTWRQLGRVGPAGQTDAGQQGERLLARAIANLVVESLNSR